MILSWKMFFERMLLQQIAFVNEICISEDFTSKIKIKTN